MHLDNFLVPLLLAVAALFKLLTSKADTARKKSEPPPQRSTFTPRPNQPPPIPTADTEEERIRDFLEALGQPTSSKPPPPVVRRPTYQKPIILPHRPPFASPLPPLTTRPPEEPARKITRPSPIITPVAKSGAPTPALQEIPIFEVQERAPTAEPTAVIAAAAAAAEVQAATEQTGSNIATLLSSPSGLRDAIILREIFGPPRSLQSLHLVGDA